MNTYAKVICDSISPLGVRLTSLEVRFPRFILPQCLMTRMWSRSCESLRARPVKSKLKEVQETPYIPLFKQNQKGMTPGEALNSYLGKRALEEVEALRTQTIATVAKLMELGVCKEIANRYLEPFAFQKVLITATDFQNFFRLRVSEQAQEEIQVLAVKMKEALDKSTPTRLNQGEYHLPYIDPSEVTAMQNTKLMNPEVLRRISAARCARVSYCNHDGQRDYHKDLGLAETLIADGHSNPLEHQCTPAPDCKRYSNLEGWVSYRYKLEREGKLPNPEG